jgi:hypothetical protein
MDQPAAKALLDTLLAYFDHDGWDYRRIEGYDAAELGVAGDNGNYRLVVLVDAQRSIVRFLTFVEGKVPALRRHHAMEYITRANYGLLLGNFEFDLSDGEVRFKYAMDVEGSDITYAQYQSLLYVSVATMDRYFPGLQSVSQGTADADAAIADIEHWEA